MMEVKKIYVDGGVIKVNPSPHGGTWAAIFLGENDMEICRHSGLVLPADTGLSTISNNFTELLAAVEGMERLPNGWNGTIFTDSNVTRCRLLGSKPGMVGIPKALQDRMWTARKRLGTFGVVLLDGHPTRKQISAGVGKRGNPVSSWNVRCDETCGNIARRFMKEQESRLPGVATI